MALFDLFFFIPEFFFFVSFFLLLLYTGAVYYNDRQSIVMNCNFILVYGAVLYVILLWTGSVTEFSVLTFHMCSDNLIYYTKYLICFIYIFILKLLHTLFYNNRKGSPEPFLLLALFFFGASLCLMVNDFFLFYLLMEFLTIISYILACLHKFSMYATEASLKYFILGALSSGFLLLGVVLLYGFTGLTNFFDFIFLFRVGLEFTHVGFGVLLAFLFILCGFLFKLSVAPFHMWVPDVYDGLLLPIVLLFSTITKVVFIVVFLKVLWFVFYDFFWLWESILLICGAISILVGSVGGLLQNNIIRLYAYSTIVNGGFFCCFLSLGSLDGLVFLFNYLIIYLVTSCALIFVLLLFQINYCGYTHGTIYLSEFVRVAGASSLLTVFLFGLVFFSYVGIPPLAGFFAKFFLLFALYKHTGFIFYFLLILFTTILTAIYYIRCIYLIFFFSEPVNYKGFDLSLNAALCLIFFCMFLCFFLFLQPLLLNFLQAVIYSICF